MSSRRAGLLWGLLGVVAFSFTVTEAVGGDHLTLTRRKDYTWGPGDWDPKAKGLPDTVVIKIVANETTTANLLISGGANAAQFVGPDQQPVRLSGWLPSYIPSLAVLYVGKEDHIFDLNLRHDLEALVRNGY